MRLGKRAAAFALIAATVGGATVANSATVTFDFESALPAPFTLLDSAPFVGPGNCLAGECIKVNKNGEDVLSIAPPLTFSVTSFWFQLLGRGDDMLIETSKGSLTLLESVFDHNFGFTFNATTSAIFDGITYVSFIMATEGNGRVDDLTVSYDPPSIVPLPAGGLLLIGGLGALFAMRRRKVA